jgi:hypothetical protein
MSSKRLSRKARKGAAQFIQKPRGVIHPRVQQIGPEHFGIVCVDPAKARSKWMLCDFYGNVIVPPKFVAHNRVELDAAISEVRGRNRRSYAKLAGAREPIFRTSDLGSGIWLQRGSVLPTLNSAPVAFKDTTLFRPGNCLFADGLDRIARRLLHLGTLSCGFGRRLFSVVASNS